MMKEKVLWLSRHAMTDEQQAELIARIRSDYWDDDMTPLHEIVQINVTLPAYGFNAVQEILNLCDQYGTRHVAAVLPAHVAAQWALNHRREEVLWLPVSVPAPAVEGETRGGGFVFSHWEAF